MDIVVVGLGAMGSAVTFQLAQAGVNVARGWGNPAVCNAADGRQKVVPGSGRRIMAAPA
ncbi:MAG TPA: hypothetical protein VIP77_00895 [Jiangellaceae bacterium]